ncbi:MAG: sigma-70 family RNA polymerase sigma factor [Clostridiales bacterium]|uniref:sigma-70 family RNA polymerase sigma factor n=1 Tax=Clostridium sp. N3C TaxID=1776758 RepID=UPI00092E03C1|nr:sigma-70 family RNA polymerase sigma factor [Clostridium sp. N3C]NLZ49292.1 sigma-70 family RNA polymerase sigma factor [Clostridiales bacterium]SCN23757.1 sporulation sigma factor SigK [Clostridium sp. N3C]
MKHFEVEAAVKRAQNGNKEELIKILDNFKAYIYKTSNKYNIKNYDMYDLLQIAYVALINAVAKYRVGSNTFTSYAMISIQNAIKLTLRDNVNYGTEVSLNAPMASEDGDPIEFLETLKNDEDMEENVIKTLQYGYLRKAIAKLPADEQELIIMVYYHNCPLTVYAKKKKISYANALRKRDKILNKLKKSL